MKCLKCGLPVKKSDKYCGNCGEKITKEKKQENSLLKFFIKYQKTILMITSIIILLLISYSITDYITSPTYVADKYFKAVTSNNIEEIYDTISLNDNDFMNANMLSKKIENHSNVTDIYVTNKIIVGNNAFITYSYKENSKTYKATVSLTNSGKKWLFFDDWKVNSGKVVTDVTFKMPKGSIIKLDDIDLSKYLSKTDENYDIYEIDYMVNGDYELSVTLLDQQEIKETISVKSDSEYTVGNIDLNDDTKSYLTNDIKDLIIDMYKNILSNVSYDTITYNDKIKTLYKNLNYNYKNSYFTLTNIEFTDFNITNSTFKNGKLNVTFEVEYNYTIDYTLNDEAKAYSGTNRGVVSASYSYEDGYKIDSIGKLSLSFPIRK